MKSNNQSCVALIAKEVTILTLQFPIQPTAISARLQPKNVKKSRQERI